MTEATELPDDLDLKNALAALKRSAQAARKLAAETRTHLIIESDGKVLRLAPSKPEHTTDNVNSAP